MTDSPPVLHVLLVEDDQENLALLQQSLPYELDGFRIAWEPCTDFQEAVQRVTSRHYDVVVTDIYRDRKDQIKGLDPDDEKAYDIVTALRECRFCPVVAFTDGSHPQTFKNGPFVRFADKSKGNDEILSQLHELLATGIPGIARKLHEELDRSGGSYLWGFLETQWAQLNNGDVPDPAVLERLVRRRAAMQLGRLDPAVGDPAELQSVQGLEYYIYPPVCKELRLGELIRSTADQTIRVVLTPHCHLTTQTGETQPRADFVLAARTFPAKERIAAVVAPKSPWTGTDDDKNDKLRRRTMLNAELGKPSGRYCFLPGFLGIPDLYCDLLQVESIPYEEVFKTNDRLAVLDTPFAEALQSCFARLYLAVGLPDLDTAALRHLMD